MVGGTFRCNIEKTEFEQCNTLFYKTTVSHTFSANQENPGFGIHLRTFALDSKKGFQRIF